MKNNSLKNLVETNIGKYPKAMNIALLDFAKENSIDITIGNNYYWGDVPAEDQVQAISFDENFKKVLSLLEAKVEPSYEELDNFLENNSDTTLTKIIKITTKDIALETEIFMDMLSKRVDYWIDMNDLKLIR